MNLSKVPIPTFKRLQLWSLLVITSAYIGPGLSYGKFYVFHLTLLVFSGILVYYFASKKTPLKQLISPYTWSVFDLLLPVSICWFTLSFLWAESSVHVFEYIVFLSFGCLVFFIITAFLNVHRHQYLILLSLALPFSLEIILWLIEFLTPYKWIISIASPYLSAFGRKAFQPEVYSDADLKNILSYPAGFHWNPNNLALIFALAMPFFFFVKNRFVSIAGSVICLLVIFSTGSRISFMAYILGILSILLILKKKFVFNYFAILLALITLSTNGFSDSSSCINAFKEIQTFAVDFIPFHEFTKETPGHVLTGESDEVRFVLLQEGFEFFKSSYGLGVGGGNDVYLQDKKGGVGNKNVTVLHNFWIELLINGGVFIALVWGFWYSRTLFVLYRKCNNISKLSYYYYAVFISMIVFLLGAASPSSCIYFLPMYILLGWANVLCKLDDTNAITVLKK